jgi:hypothetical protein
MTGQVVITVTHDDGCGNTEHAIATDRLQRSFDRNTASRSNPAAQGVPTAR